MIDQTIAPANNKWKNDLITDLYHFVLNLWFKFTISRDLIINNRIGPPELWTPLTFSFARGNSINLKDRCKISCFRYPVSETRMKQGTGITSSRKTCFYCRGLLSNIQGKGLLFSEQVPIFVNKQNNRYSIIMITILRNFSHYTSWY
jgi:hypothetical protein